MKTIDLYTIIQALNMNHRSMFYKLPSSFKFVLLFCQLCFRFLSSNGHFCRETFFAKERQVIFVFDQFCDLFARRFGHFYQIYQTCCFTSQTVWHGKMQQSAHACYQVAIRVLYLVLF